MTSPRRIVVVRYARESPIERKVAEDAEKLLGILSVKLTPRGQVGYPDRLFFIPGGRPLLIEFKRPGDKPREIQVYVREQLRARGYQVETCDTYDGAMAAIRGALDAARRAAESGQVPRGARSSRTVR